MPEVNIYTRQYCSFCTLAKHLLDRHGVAYIERDATGKPEVRAEMIQRSRGAMTFPQIFIGDRHIGGCTDLYDFAENGGLDRLLAESAGASA
jgi:glutaredoxin 3